MLSALSQANEAALFNHRAYAQELGYDHRCVDLAGASSNEQLRVLFKYEEILRNLGDLTEGGVLLVLSDSAAIVRPLALERLMEGRDWLVTRSTDANIAQTNVQVWRNTPSCRALLQGVVMRSRLVKGQYSHDHEGALFADVEPLHWRVLVSGQVAVMPAGPNVEPLWQSVDTFAISIDNMRLPPESQWSYPRFNRALVERINRYRATGLPLFEFPEYDECDSTDYTAFQPGGNIALVTLYTSAIRNYGRIAELNFRRYCERHGYALHVYRALPPEIPSRASGNWAKPWLVRKHLREHDWVFWMDADVLVNDMGKSLESLIEGRDWVMARDIMAVWDFNSGVMGFKNTPGNHSLLAGLEQRIMALDDLSSVYSGGGDQPYFIEAMRSAGRLAEAEVFDLATINTPWTMRQPGSFIVHYYDMWHDCRALLMAHDTGLPAKP